MNDFDEESQQYKGRFSNLENVRRKIRSMDSIEDSVRDEILHDLEEVSRKIITYRLYLERLESNLKSFIGSAELIDQDPLENDILNCHLAEKRLFEKFFGGILVNRLHFENAIARLQIIEQERREGRI